MRTILGLLLFIQILSAQITNFQWPLAPVNEQHRISATFDECREDRDHFHSGTDMPLGQGGAVKSIMPGQVLSFEAYGGNSYIRVEDFAYVHVDPDPALHVGDYVAAGQVIGWTNDQNHIHLNYGGGSSGHPYGNPLLPDRIQPFEDPYHPRSPEIWFTPDGLFTPFPGTNLSGRVDILARASDTTDTQSSIDMNNGIYEIGWALYSADTSTVLAGPSFWFEANQLYSNSYIENVYAPGSSTSTYIYIVTNRISTNGFLNCDLYTPGPYVVAVMSRDTRQNWDTTFVNITINEEDLFPPGQPVLNYVGADAAGELSLSWEPPPDPDLLGYRLEFSFDGENWSSNHGPDVLTAGMTSYSIAGFPQNSTIHFRLIGLDNAPIPNESIPSDTYSARLDANAPQVLIVDGFDRVTGSWSLPYHDFCLAYSQALVATGYAAGIQSATNEWAVEEGDLSPYAAVIWFLGDDSRTDETFDASEQSLLQNYLDNGGSLFASGAEIGYDLAFGNSDDLDFLQNTLHVSYAGDDANNQNLTGLAPYFSGVTLTYGDTPYIEDWPDYFEAVNGGSVAVKYGNDLNAAILYEEDDTRVLTLGLAFETISGQAGRTEFMDRILGFLLGTSSTEITSRMEFRLEPVFPNPVNGQLRIPLQVEEKGHYQSVIFDLQGREVYRSQPQSLEPGRKILLWSGLDQSGRLVASGTYILQIRNPEYVIGYQSFTVIK